MEDRSLRIAFHSALDEVAPPAPWLATALRENLLDRRRRATAYPARRYPGRTRFALAGLAMVVVAIALLAGLLLTQLYTPIQVKHPDPQPSPAPPEPRYFRSLPLGGLQPVKMTNSTTGWATGGLRTTDGGQHWRDVTPPWVPGATTRHPEFYLDASRAWQGQMAPNRLVIFRTTDGGKSWAQSSQQFPSGYSATLSFVDADHGWLVTGSWPIGEPPDPKASGLYKTADGGLHWTLLSKAPAGTPTGCLFAGGLAFVTLTTGWVGLACPLPQPSRGMSSRLMATRDGGTTWKIEDGGNGTLCAPCTFSSPPTIFDTQHWMVLTMDGLFMTENGGATWDKRELPPNHSSGSSISIIDPNFGWVFEWTGVSSGSSRLYRTTDGGRHWTLVQSNLEAQLRPLQDRGQTVEGMADLMFVDARKGFATHRFSTPNGVQLLRTTDGGETWTEVPYQLELPDD